MPVFLERFVLTVLAAIVMGVVVLNPFKLDWHQRISLLVAVVALAYFVGRTVYVTKPPQAPQVVAPTAAPHVSGNASTTGNNSPANTGDGNTFNIGTSNPKK